MNQENYENQRLNSQLRYFYCIFSGCVGVLIVYSLFG